MTDSIVRNSSPTVPIANLRFVTGYDGGHRIENVLNPQLNGEGYNVTYRPARLRSGTLRLLFASAAHAWAAVAVLKTSHTFTLTADVSELGMTFVLRPGELKPNPGSGDVSAPWLVEVPFQEVQ